MEGTELKGTIQIGQHTFGLPTIMSWRTTERLDVGKFCMIAPNVTILLGGEHNPKRVSVYTFKNLFKRSQSANLDSESKGNVVIGNDVWVGTGSIILSGVHINDGAIIGAGSIVTHDVAPYAIVAGNPAKVIRLRFSKEQIEKLLSIAWWNWDEKKIRANIDYFYGDIDHFIKKFFINEK